MKTSIYKFAGNRAYTKISNTLLQNKELSFKARGLLAYILSLPDSWEIYVEFLVEQSPGGREVVQSAIKELKELGYMRFESIRDEATGKIVKHQWVAFDDPAENLQLTSIRESRSLENQRAVNPIAGEPAAIKEIQSIKEIQNKENTMASPVGAADSAGESIPQNEVAAAEPKKIGKRNELLDTLAKIDGADPFKVPQGVWGKYAKVLKDIKSVTPDVTPSVLLRTAKRYQQIHPKWDAPTATALASHWGECYTDEKPEPQKTIAEPIGWKAFVDVNMPDCPYAGATIVWGQVDPEHQVWINTAMIEDSKKRGVA